MVAEELNNSGIPESFRKKFEEKAEKSQLGNLNAKNIKVREKKENKISEKVLQVAESLIKESSSLREYNMSIILTVLAWNFSLFPEDEAEKYFEECFEEANFNNDDKLIFRLLIEKLKKKKLKLFPDVNAYIVDYEVKETADQFRLSVASHEFTGERGSDSNS